MASEDFSVQAGSETLRGTIEWSPQKTPPSLLLIHGAGTGNAPRWAPTAQHFAQQGITSVRFNFSGHGDSSGKMRDSSLPKRLEEARIVAEKFFGFDGPPLLAGSSMGGPIAARLTRHYGVESLILMCPAAYAQAAETVEFDERFTAILRTPDSWKDSKTWDDIAAYQGRLLHVIGEHDAVIPQGVTEGYKNAAHDKARFEIVKGADHSLNLWLDTHPDERARVWRVMLETMRS